MKIDILNNNNDLKLFCKLENKAFQCGEGCELCPLKRAYDIQKLCDDKHLSLQNALISIVWQRGAYLLPFLSCGDNGSQGFGDFGTCYRAEIGQKPPEKVRKLPF